MCPDIPFPQESRIKFSPTGALLSDSKKVSLCNSAFKWVKSVMPRKSGKNVVDFHSESKPFVFQICICTFCNPKNKLLCLKAEVGNFYKTNF